MFTFTVSSRRFHCWSPEDNSSALFNSCKALIRSKSSFSMLLCGSPEVMFRKNYRSLEADGCSVSLCVSSSASSQSREICWWRGGFWNRQTFTVRHCANSWWYIWVIHCPLFLLGNPFVNRRHNTQVAVCKVICLLTLYHGHCKWHQTSFAIHQSVELWWTGRAEHSSRPGRYVTILK